jgi:rhodanese-related sulfurtransferase
MGWHLAGLTCDSGKTARAPAVSERTLAWAKSAAEDVARRFGIARIDHARLDRWRKDETRTLYIFDVREPAEYEAGHLPGAISAPGGQLVQATDTYAGTLGARIVVCDDAEVRALMTASWLRQMGWRDVFVLGAAGGEPGYPAPEILGEIGDGKSIECHALAALLDEGKATVIDLSPSPAYRRGHIPGAWFAIRARLDRALKTIGHAGELVFTSEDGTLAGLAASGMAACWLKGGNAAWQAAGLPLSTESRMADEPVDVWLKPYEQLNDHEAAMNAYLSWEIDLLDRIKRDGTTRFMSAR